VNELEYQVEVLLLALAFLAITQIAAQMQNFMVGQQLILFANLFTYLRL